MDENQNNIWINREEYQRLRSIEAQIQPKQPVEISAGVTRANDTEFEEAKNKSSSTINTLTIMMGIAAVISFIYPPFLLLFLSLGIATISNFFRNKTKSSNGTTATKVVGVVLGVVGTALIIYASAPLIVFIFFIGMFTIISGGHTPNTHT